MKGALKHTWKLLAILLFGYACYMSFFLPMAPGIYQATKVAETDTTIDLSLLGYNTNLEGSNPKVWLQKDSLAVPALEYFNEEGGAVARFSKRHLLETGNYHLFSYNDVDKTLFLPTAYYHSQLADSTSKLAFDKTSYLVPRSGFEIPYKTILYETIRNLNFHVCMWFVLLVLMTYSVVYSIKSLRQRNAYQSDLRAEVAARTGLYFAILGIASGSIWAKYTWGAWWVNDPKLNGAALSTLVYLAYLVLRKSIEDPEKKARISAVYNVFAYVLMIVFIQILPRLTDSLHPGNGGNPAFSQYDLDNNLRAIFYPATLGWILIGVWIWQISTRIREIQNKYEQA